VNDEEWICALAAAMGKQFSLYAHFSSEKVFSLVCAYSVLNFQRGPLQKFLLKLLGVVLAKVKNQQFVVDHLDLMFRCVNLSSHLERSVNQPP